MHSISILSTLALVGSAFAAPIAEPEVVKVVVTATSVVVVTAGAEPTKPAAPAAPAAPVDQKVGVQNYGNRRPAKPSVVVVTEVYNAATTKVADSYKPVTTQAPPAPAPPKTTQAPAAPKPSSSYAAVKPAPAPSSSSAAAPKPSSAPSTGGSGGNYMDVVSEWRAKMGLKELKQDAKLEANAYKTCRDGNGSMKHQLNEGTFGQVLAPGKATEFEHVFVGGWLCEVPTTKGLNGICTTASKGWTYEDANGKKQTGHNEILVDPKFTKIGCAMVQDIWGCDLGY